MRCHTRDIARACSSQLQSGRAVNVNNGRPETWLGPPGHEGFAQTGSPQRVVGRDLGGRLSDKHAAGTPGGGSASGGLAGTNVGRGSPTESNLEKAMGGGRSAAGSDSDDEDEDAPEAFSGRAGAAVGGTPATSGPREANPPPRNGRRTSGQPNRRSASRVDGRVAIRPRAGSNSSTALDPTHRQARRAASLAPHADRVLRSWPSHHCGAGGLSPRHQADPEGAVLRLPRRAQAEGEAAPRHRGAGRDRREVPGPRSSPGSAASLLLQRVSDTDDRTRMPPEGQAAHAGADRAAQALDRARGEGPGGRAARSRPREALGLPARPSARRCRSTASAGEPHRRVPGRPNGETRLDAGRRNGQGHTAAPRLPRPDRPAADARRAARVPGGHVARRLREGGRSAARVARSTASAGPGTGWTSGGTPTGTAAVRCPTCSTATARSGDGATGSSAR